MKYSNGLVLTFTAIVLLLVAAAPATGQGLEDFSFQIGPGLEIPVGSRSALFNEGSAYQLGASADLTGQYIFPQLPLLYMQGDLNYQFYSTPGTAPWLNLITLGFGAGVNTRIGNVMSLQSGLETGIYVGIFGDSLGANPYFGGDVTVGWDLSPGFSLTAGVGYRYFLGTEQNGDITDLAQGARISLGTAFRPVRGGDRSKVEVENVAFAPIFPVFYGYYDQNPLGSVTVTNRENSAITNVKVYFNVSEYMEQPKLSAEIPVIQRGESVDVDLNALFRSSVLQINSDTLVQSEIITEYTYLGRQFTRRVPHTLRIHGRNSMTWDDDRKAASFVNAKDPTVLLFSKNTAGLIREASNDPINLNLKIAMGIFEALRAYGMTYVIDPDSSYIELSQNSTALDTLLFPSESLTYRAGDCDDLAILYTSLLESVGIETSFITIPGHIYTAFSLDMTEKEARAQFTNINDFMFIEGNTWLPVETTLMTDGFMKAWRTGARQWRDNSSKGTAAVFPIHEAWQVYETAPTQTPPVALVFPSAQAILAGYREGLDEFVEQEMNEALTDFQARIDNRGDNAITRNRLGVLYARYGLYNEAETEFQRSALRDVSYVAPLINLGNISYLREDHFRALDFYRQAEVLRPDSIAILAGLARTQYELEQYEGARDDYNRLVVRDPEIANEYAYIGDQSSAVGRAAAAQDRGRTLWEDDEEEE